MSQKIADQNFLNSIFPAQRADEFFEALFGGAEDGAYDIQLVFRRQDPDKLTMAFNLLQRPGKCLRCNLTYGLPQVFARHPIINVKQVAEDLAKECGFAQYHYELGQTEKESDALHSIPLTIFRDL